MGSCTSCKGADHDADECNLNKQQRDRSSWERLLRLRACEPWCFNGQCTPGAIPGFTPGDQDPNCPGGVWNGVTGRCEPMTKPRSGMRAMVLEDLIRELARQGHLEVCTVDGVTGFRLPTPPGAAPYMCVPWERCKWDPCWEFGPHWNCERRSSDMSPSDVHAVMRTYAWQTATITGVTAVPGNANWYYVALGALNVSHTFCVEEITAIVTAGGPNVANNVAIGGERIVCAPIKQGAYQHAGETPVAADPGDIDITPERCACKTLCAKTPARGNEFVYFHTAAPIAAGNHATTVVTVKIARKCWLECVEPCVLPIDSMIPVGPSTTELQRVADVILPAQVPFLPV